VTEFNQMAGDRVDGQADDGGDIATDGLDERQAPALDGISASAEKGAFGSDITAQLGVGPGSEGDLGLIDEAMDAAGAIVRSGADQADRGPDPVGLAAEAAEHGECGGGMGRFPDECAVEFKDGIGAEIGRASCRERVCLYV
jgi:hypothetical protein